MCLFRRETRSAVEAEGSRNWRGGGGGIVGGDLEGKSKETRVCDGWVVMDWTTSWAF